jgi:hypothetical protein
MADLWNGLFVKHTVKGGALEKGKTSDGNSEGLLEGLMALVNACFGDEKRGRRLTDPQAHNPREHPSPSKSYELTRVESGTLDTMLRKFGIYEYTKKQMVAMIRKLDSCLDSIPSHFMQTLDQKDLEKMVDMKKKRNTLARKIGEKERHFTLGSHGAHPELKARYPLGLIPHEKALEIERLLLQQHPYTHSYMDAVLIMANHLLVVLHLLRLEIPLASSTFSQAHISAYQAEMKNLESDFQNLQFIIMHRRPPPPTGKPPPLPPYSPPL